MMHFTATIEHYGSKKSRRSITVVGVTLAAAKADALAQTDASRLARAGDCCILSVVVDGEVTARHMIVRSTVGKAVDGAVVSVPHGKWKEIALPAATVASRGYRVVGRYDSARGWSMGTGQDVCDRCGSGIARVVVVEDRTGKQHHVGTDCAQRMGMPVR